MCLKEVLNDVKMTQRRIVPTIVRYVPIRKREIVFLQAFDNHFRHLR